MDRLFENKPDYLVLAFDTLMTEIMSWEPNTVGTSVNTIIFANKRTWLIIRPMTKELDVKFYASESIDNERFKKIQDYNGKFAHHLRVREEEEIDEEFLALLKIGYDYGMR